MTGDELDRAAVVNHPWYRGVVDGIATVIRRDPEEAVGTLLEFYTLALIRSRKELREHRRDIDTIQVMAEEAEEDWELRCFIESCNDE